MPNLGLVRALVILPTVALASQVAASFRLLGGGVSVSTFPSFEGKEDVEEVRGHEARSATS